MPKPFVAEEEEEDGWLIIDLPGEEKKLRVGIHLETLFSKGKDHREMLMDTWGPLRLGTPNVSAMLFQGQGSIDTLPVHLT